MTSASSFHPYGVTNTHAHTHICKGENGELSNKKKMSGDLGRIRAEQFVARNSKRDSGGPSDVIIRDESGDLLGEQIL